MSFLKFFLSWKFWLNLLIVVGVVYGIYFFIFKIWLSSYTNHGESVTIPDLSQMDIFQATETLDKLGLTYEVDSVKFDVRTKPYAVMEFYPEEGSFVKQGRRIFIKSNPKTHRPVELPDLISKSKRLAFTQIDIAGLIVGDTIYEPDIAKDAVLRVLLNGKEIKAGTVLPRFTKIDLVLGRGLMLGVNAPNFLGMTLDQAKHIIKENYFEVGNITYEGEEDSITGRIFYQYPMPNEVYDQGLPVDLWISNKPSTELTNIIKALDIQYKLSPLDIPQVDSDRYQDSVNDTVIRYIESDEDLEKENHTPVQPAPSNRNGAATPKTAPNKGKNDGEINFNN